MIRTMKETDIEAIQHIAAISWHATYEGIIPRDIQKPFLQQAYSVERLKERLVNTNFYVAVKDDEVVGYANFSALHDNDEVELAAIYVLPSEQGKGIGSQLLTHGINELSPRAIYLNVEKENLVGRQFYEAKGFEITDSFEEPFFGHTLKTLTYRKVFTSSCL